jgi:ATP-dependent RNA helicase DeaD
MNLPDEVEYYTHRSGRTARAGNTGFSIAIITRRDMHKIRQIEKKANVQFVQTLVPTGVEVCEKRVLELVHRLHDVKINEKDIANFLPAVFAELEDLSKEDIITRFASLEFNRYFDYYSGSADLNKKAEPRDRDRDSGGKDRDSGRERGEGRGTGGSRADDGDYERMFMSIGKMEGLDNGKLLGFILQRCNVPKRAVGRITVKGAYSFFEAETEFADTIKNMLHGFDYKGRRIRVEIETDKPKRDAKKTSQGKREGRY